MSHPWNCPRPGRAELGATWDSEQHPGGGTGMSFKVLSNPSFSDSIVFQAVCKQRFTTSGFWWEWLSREGLLHAQPEQLQGQPGKCGDFGKVHPAESFPGGFWE